MGNCLSGGQHPPGKKVVHSDVIYSKVYVPGDINKDELAERYALPVDKVTEILARGHCEGPSSADCICYAYCLTGYGLDLALEISANYIYDKATVLRR